MRLVLVRHGDAFAGFHGPIGGPTGCRGLTELGRRQAQLLADDLQRTSRIDVEVLLTSMIPRAIETAATLARALGHGDVEQDCDLCELHTGDADGVDWADYADRFGALDMHAEPDQVFAPGGESWNGFHRRVEAVMNRLAVEHAHRTVMAVCHAGVIASTLRVRFGGPTLQAARLVPTHTGLTTWDHDDATGAWTLRGYDDARHLDRVTV